MEKNLLQGHEHARSLAALLSNFTNQEQDAILVRSHLLKNLLGIQCCPTLQDHQKIQELLKLLEQEILWNSIPGRELSGQDRKELLETCEGIRLHVVAAACHLGKSSECCESQNTAIPHTLPGTVCYGASGATYTLLHDKMVMLLPQITAPEESQELLIDFTDIYDGTPHGVSWAIDFSLVQTLPEYLIGTLLSYQDQLNFKGGQMYLCWVQEHTLSEARMELLVRLFNLTKHGNYHFSKAILA